MLFRAWWQPTNQPGEPSASLLVEHWAKQTFAICVNLQPFFWIGLSNICSKEKSTTKNLVFKFFPEIRPFWRAQASLDVQGFLTLSYNVQRWTPIGWDPARWTLQHGWKWRGEGLPNRSNRAKARRVVSSQGVVKRLEESGVGKHWGFNHLVSHLTSPNFLSPWTQGLYWPSFTTGWPSPFPGNALWISNQTLHLGCNRIGAWKEEKIQKALVTTTKQ